MQGSGIRVQLDVEPDLPQIQGDPHQLQQVFLNILINAEQALRHGGRTVRIAARSVTSSTLSDSLVVTFYNDGPAIPAEVLPRIFEPLFTTKGADEGTGLGLAICRRIVREHGGEIDVETGPDGTTFRVLLPTGDAAA
jgi:signal transduction histidine kinase